MCSGCLIREEYIFIEIVVVVVAVGDVVVEYYAPLMRILDDVAVSLYYHPVEVKSLVSITRLLRFR